MADWRIKPKAVSAHIVLQICSKSLFFKARPEPSLTSRLDTYFTSKAGCFKYAAFGRPLVLAGIIAHANSFKEFGRRSDHMLV